MDQLFSSLFDSPGGDPEVLICVHTDEANPWSTLQDDAGLWLCCGNKDSAAHLHLPLSEIFAVEYKGLGPVGQFNPSGFCGLATPQQQVLWRTTSPASSRKLNKIYIMHFLEFCCWSIWRSSDISSLAYRQVAIQILVATNKGRV